MLRRAAEKAEEGFTEGLAQDAQAGKGGEAGGEVGVTAPGQCVGEFARVARGVEIMGKSGAGRRRQRGGGGPVQAAGGVESEPDDAAVKYAGPDPVVTVPAEGLAAIEGLGEDTGGERRAAEFQWLPAGPAGAGRGAAHLSGFSQRKLFAVPSRRPSVVTTSIFHATGWTFSPAQSAPVSPRLKTVSPAGRAVVKV